MQQFSGQRDVNFDLNVRFSSGESAEIEMQAWPQYYDYGKRAEYQVARLLSTYLITGDDWDRVYKVYQISILDYNYYVKDAPERNFNDSIINCYTMKNQDGHHLTDILNVIFVELTKCREISDYSDEELKELSPAEKWALFFKNADNTGSSKIVNNLCNLEAGIMEAQNVLSSISSDRALWLSQYHAEIRERDRISNLKGMKRIGLERGMKKGLKKGMKRGLEQGLQQGIAQGHEQGLKDGVNLLANLLKSGMSLDAALKQLENPQEDL